jgi:hypothetical protein
MLKLLQTTAVVIVALACMAPSMAVNAVHQFTHTPGPLAWPLAGAAVLSVLLAGSSPFAMETALSQRRFGVFLAALAAFVVCASYNLASAVGAASTARSDITGARTADNARATLLTGQLAQAEKSRAALAAASGEQTPGMIDGALSALRNDARWSRSKGCADATRDDSRAFCAEYAQKQATRDAAAKVAELDRDMTAIKARLLTATGATAGQPADPQADNIANALELVGGAASAGKIGMGLNLWFALTIEVLGSLGPIVFAVVFASVAGSSREPRPTLEPAPVVASTPPVEPADAVPTREATAEIEPQETGEGPEVEFTGLRLAFDRDAPKPPAPKPGTVAAWLADATTDTPGFELRGSDALRAYVRYAGDASETSSASQFRKLISKALGRQRRAQIVSKNSGFVLRNIALKSANVGGDVGGNVGDDVARKMDPTLA